MSNSSLVRYTKISPNKTVGRNHTIDTITPHCVVGQCSVETLGNIFAPVGKQASSNYGIGADGRIGMYCEEKDRSWCTSSSANDNRAITIECASDAAEPYAFKDVVYKALIELCVDVCKRNGKTKLLWLGDKARTLAYTPASDEMLLTVHRWFANKSCPGDWMFARMGDLAEKVTAALGGVVAEDKSGCSAAALYRVQCGAYSSLANAANLRDKLEAAGFKTYLVRADDGLYKVQTGAYAEPANAQAQVAKLKVAKFDGFITTKSGTPVTSATSATAGAVLELRVGDKVKMSSDATVYNTNGRFQSWVYEEPLCVRLVAGDKVIVSVQQAGAVTGAVHKRYLTKV